MGSGVPVGDLERVQRIKSYVLRRLRAELAASPRGGQARLAHALGVSGAHLSNMLSASPTRQPGEDFRRRVAAHWGLSYAALEALALGEAQAPATPEGPRAEGFPENLAYVLAHYEWMPELPATLRLVVGEQARQHHVFGESGDFSIADWQRIVTGLEREALSLVARQQRAASVTAPRLEGDRKQKAR